MFCPRFCVFLVVDAWEDVIVVNHGEFAVLNLVRRHAILGSEFFDCLND